MLSLALPHLAVAVILLPAWSEQEWAIPHREKKLTGSGLANPRGHGCSAEKGRSPVPPGEFLAWVGASFSNTQFCLDPGCRLGGGGRELSCYLRAVLPFCLQRCLVIPLPPCPWGHAHPVPLSWAPSLLAHAHLFPASPLLPLSLILLGFLPQTHSS